MISFMWKSKTDNLVEINSRLVIKRHYGWRRAKMEKRKPIGKI